MSEQERLTDARVAEIATSKGPGASWVATIDEAVALAREVQARRAAEGATGAALRAGKAFAERVGEILDDLRIGIHNDGLRSAEWRKIAVFHFEEESARAVVVAAQIDAALSALSSAHPHAQDGGAGAGVEGAVNDLRDAAARVYSKFGSDSDWVEWTDLRDALAALDACTTGGPSRG